MRSKQTNKEIWKASLDSLQGVDVIPWYTKDYQNAPGRLLMFGENLASKVSGDTTPASSAQAVLRGHPDSLGMCTCLAVNTPYDTRKRSEHDNIIKNDIEELKQRFRTGGYSRIGLPADAFGLGAARMHKSFFRKMLSELHNAVIELVPQGKKDASPAEGKEDEKGPTHVPGDGFYGGRWIFGKSNTLNMGALPAIIGFLRVGGAPRFRW